uniref:Uncharacterized protein n=1 Tax=Cannabis sativa TaxID=3483 RepID=A0A803QTF7_CANSA
MDLGATWRRNRSSSCERLAVIVMGLLAVISPLYIDRREVIDPEEEETSIDFESWVGGSSGGILVILLILALVLKCKASFGN